MLLSSSNQISLTPIRHKKEIGIATEDSTIQREPQQCMNLSEVLLLM